MTKALTQVRCAIYTRKSSEEGLDQAFNSLHAQREACEAYVKSQIGEGWVCLKTAYDDGGISGGTLERPGLRRLLADIEDGLIDVVVVYKVDRLTRSLTDFAKIIDVFDRKTCSFVSITQAFNTTSSMGRLTLNMLLSFAQYEREVTGERIRDKIAASKAKGMWMGGLPPLGYDVPEDRTTRALKINPAEADLVRDIYARYLRLKSVNAVRDDLARDGLVSKAWTSREGRAMGGKPFNTGSLFHLLQSRVYIGEIVHGDKRHPGMHEAIVEREVFDAVQAQLAANACRRQAGPKLTGALPLQGLTFDAEGARMVPTFGYARSGKRHAYYVSAPLLKAQKIAAGTIGRISARPFEDLVRQRVGELAGKPDAGLDDVRPLIRRIDVGPHGLCISLDQQALLEGGASTAKAGLQSRLTIGDAIAFETPNAHTLQLMVQVRPVFRGGRTWLVRPNGQPAIDGGQPDRKLLKALAQAHAGLVAFDAAPSCTADQWGRAKAVPDSYLRQTVGFAFLAPDIQVAILEGRQPAGLTARQILQQGVPAAWADQRRLFGF